MLSQDIRKLFSFSQIFINVPWWWSAPSCAGSHHFTKFGSWSGVAKVIHLKVIEQPHWTLFVTSFPPRQWQWQQQQQHLHAHTTHEQWHGIPHQQEGHMTYRNVNGATTMATQTNGAQSPHWSKVQHSMAGGQQGRRIGTGLSEEWGNTFVHIYGRRSGPMSGP